RNPGHPGTARPGALCDPQLRPRARLTRGHEAVRREPYQGRPGLALVFPDHALGAGSAAARRGFRPGHPLFGGQIHGQAGARTLPRAEGFPDRPVREHPRDLYLDLSASASGDERHQDAVDGTGRKVSLTRRSPDVLAKELERARARELRALGVIRATLVAVEAVAGRVDEGLRARVLRRGLLRRVDRDRLIGLAPVEHHRALRLFAGVVRDSAAVVAR